MLNQAKNSLFVMSMAIRIDETIYNAARQTAKAEYRTVARLDCILGKAALDNPDLPTDFIRDILVAGAQGRALAEPFVPEDQHD